MTNESNPSHLPEPNPKLEAPTEGTAQNSTEGTGEGIGNQTVEGKGETTLSSEQLGQYQEIKTIWSVLLNPDRNSEWLSCAERISEHAQVILASQDIAAKPHDYALWHAMAGSTPVSMNFPHFDFDGVHAIYPFIKKLYDEHVAAGNIS